MNKILINDEVVTSRIYLIRNAKVMIDKDLAILYDVETRALNQAVRRNIKRFPDDFMFQMTKEEMDNWMSQIVITKSKKMGLRKPPLVFTELGVAMLSSILSSERAIMVNIQIMRIFSGIRELLAKHVEILQKFEQIEQKAIDQDEKIMLIFEYIKQLEKVKLQESEQKNRVKIGYKK